METAQATGGNPESHLHRVLSVLQPRTNSRWTGMANTKHLGRQAYEGWPGLTGAPSPVVSHLHRRPAERLGSDRTWKEIRKGKCSHDVLILLQRLRSWALVSALWHYCTKHHCLPLERLFVWPVDNRTPASNGPTLEARHVATCLSRLSGRSAPGDSASQDW